MNGYPSIVKTSDNNYFFVYAKEISSSDTDTWGGNYTSNGQDCDVVLECQAGTPPVIDDSVSCTDDSCDEATDTIINAVNDTNCDNGLWCDGAETCDVLNDCQAGTAPDCNDVISCTLDVCNEQTDSCSNAVVDSLCDNGLWCDGFETCDATLDCQAGTPPVIDDNVSCTEDFCDETTDTIINAVNDTNCDNGLWCDGTETCDTLLDCQAGTPMDCSLNNLATIKTCTNDPDNNPFTWDYFIGFTSECDEQNDVCATGIVDLTHACSVGNCSAECDSNDDCQATECDNLDGCYNDIYRDYDDVENSCLNDCACETNTCTNYAEEADSDGDGYSSSCGDCNDNNLNIHPAATEICNDNIDNDCDDNIDLDDSDCGECYLNSDCGTDAYTNNPYCIDDDVYQPYRTYTCNNPGTSSASCSYTDTDTLKESCTNFCYEGECASNTIIPFTFKDVTDIRYDNSKLLTGFISAMYHNNKTPINYGRVGILRYSTPNFVDYSYYNPGNVQPSIRKEADPNERGFLEIGVYDITEEQTITITTDNGIINVYIPAITDKYGGARYYVADDGSTYHTSSTHSYPNGYSGVYDLSLTDALKPEHLARSSSVQRYSKFYDFMPFYGIRKDNYFIID